MKKFWYILLIAFLLFCIGFVAYNNYKEWRAEKDYNAELLQAVDFRIEHTIELNYTGSDTWHCYYPQYKLKTGEWKPFMEYYYSYGDGDRYFQPHVFYKLESCQEYLDAQKRVIEFKRNARAK